MHTNNIHLDQHASWENLAKMPNAEKQLAQAMINQLVQNTADRVKTKYFADLPAGLQLHIDKMLQWLQPQVNWKRVIRLFTERSSRTFLYNTMKRPSKRYGITPGIKIRKRKKILAVIDTSGSIIEEEVKEFFNELYFLWKQKAEILVLECDMEIRNTYFYRGITPHIVSGGGGTSFEAPINYANTKYNPDAILYFTDGYAEIPYTISQKPILWLITKNGITENDVLWANLPGKKVKFN